MTLFARLVVKPEDRGRARDRVERLWELSGQDGVPELQLAVRKGCALRVDPRVALDGVAHLRLVVADEVEAQLPGQLRPLRKCSHPQNGKMWIGQLGYMVHSL